MAGAKTQHDVTLKQQIAQAHSYFICCCYLLLSVPARAAGSCPACICSDGICMCSVFKRMEQRQSSAKDPADRSALKKLARRLRTVHDELKEYDTVLEW